MMQPTSSEVTGVVEAQPAVGRLFTKITTGIREQPWSNPLVVGLLLGFLALVAFAATRDDTAHALAVAVLVAGAALACGAILGFLFGIPRVVQEPAGPSGALPGFDNSYRVNTNLEQISDWLTKIMVGVGLVELGQIPSTFASVAQYFAAAFGSPTVPPGFVAAMLTFFGVGGFLTTYLWTRLLLTLEFTRADRAARQSPEFYEGLIQALLYQPAPAGFQSAIQAGQDFLKQFGEGNWRVWRSLACAYAQRFSYLKAVGGTADADLQAVENQALDAVKRVLALNRDEREGLRALWDPERATPQEDDLVAFFDRPAFKEVLEPSKEAPSRGRGQAAATDIQ